MIIHIHLNSLHPETERNLEADDLEMRRGGDTIPNVVKFD